MSDLLWALAQLMGAWLSCGASMTLLVSLMVGQDAEWETREVQQFLLLGPLAVFPTLGIALMLTLGWFVGHRTRRLARSLPARSRK